MTPILWISRNVDRRLDTFEKRRPVLASLTVNGVHIGESSKEIPEEWDTFEIGFLVAHYSTKGMPEEICFNEDFTVQGLIGNSLEVDGAVVLREGDSILEKANIFSNLEKIEGVTAQEVSFRVSSDTVLTLCLQDTRVQSIYLGLIEMDAIDNAPLVHP
jgi:hypothetical protein